MTMLKLEVAIDFPHLACPGCGSNLPESFVFLGRYDADDVRQHYGADHEVGEPVCAIACGHCERLWSIEPPYFVVTGEVEAEPIAAATA